MAKRLAAALLLFATTIAAPDSSKAGTGGPCTALTNSIFLKIAGIPGDSRDPCHRDEIEPFSFQNSERSITVTKKIDVSSPRLFHAALVGTHFAEAHLTVFQAGAQPKLIVYRMKDAIVSSIDQVAGNANREIVTLRFATLVTEIKEVIGSAQSATRPAGIDVTFLAAGTQSTATMVSGGVSGGQLREFVVNKPMDAASPQLTRALLSRQQLPEVVITLKPRGTDATFTYRLYDVVVSGDMQHGASASEQVRLKPSKISLEYNSSTQPQQKMDWDVKAQTKS